MSEGDKSERDAPLEVLFDRRIPADDNRERDVCRHCGFVEYVNPKVVVGAICTWGSRVLLCRRAIEPRAGYWTMPAGFLEEGETTEEGARRETAEEACADITIDALLGIYHVIHLSQVQLFFTGRLTNPSIVVGPESQVVGLFEWSEIPWRDLAFQSVTWALERFDEVRDRAEFVPFTYP